MQNLEQLIDTSVAGLGYELVDVEHLPRGLLRVTIDQPAEVGTAIVVEDCERVSHQLTRVFEVEGVDYARLEVSSPGVDRPLRKPADYERFVGQQITLKLRVAVAGRRNFAGVLQPAGQVTGAAAESADQQYDYALWYHPDAVSGVVSGGKGSKHGLANKKSGQQSARKNAPPEPTHCLNFNIVDVESARLVPVLNFRSKEK